MTTTSESLLKFPCSFPVKAMGLDNAEFETAVLDILNKHAPGITEGALKYHRSKENKYLSITITIEANSQDQLDAIYYDLTAHPLVLVAL